MNLLKLFQLPWKKLWYYASSSFLIPFKSVIVTPDSVVNFLSGFSILFFALFCGRNLYSYPPILTIGYVISTWKRLSSIPARWCHLSEAFNTALNVYVGGLRRASFCFWQIYSHASFVLACKSSYISLVRPRNTDFSNFSLWWNRNRDDLEWNCGCVVLQNCKTTGRNQAWSVKKLKNLNGRLLPEGGARSCTQNRKWLETPPTSKDAKDSGNTVNHGPFTNTLSIFLPIGFHFWLFVHVKRGPHITGPLGYKIG